MPNGFVIGFGPGSIAGVFSGIMVKNIELCLPLADGRGIVVGAVIAGIRLESKDDNSG